MKTIRIVLVAVFGLLVGLMLLTGVLFPSARDWLYVAAGMCGLHVLLALIVTVCKMADAGKIAAWCWQGISTLICVSLLITHSMRNDRGWLRAAAGLLGFTMLVTLVFGLVLKPTTQLQNPKS